MAKNPVKVFVSYSWEQEKQTGVVDELERLCRQRDIQLIRDKNAMQHGELIRDFMDRLSGGEHIITIFSDAYFRSTWCMYELLTMWQKGSFHSRTHPMVVDAIDLQNDQYRLEITDFWIKEHETAASNLQGRDQTTVIKELERVKHYRDYYQNINELLNFAAGRLTTPLGQLKQQNYAPILDKISPLQDICDGFSDDEFLQEIKTILSQDLDRSETLRDYIVKSCELNVIPSGGLHGYMIEQCLQGEFVQIVQNLQSAFVDSCSSLGNAKITEIRNLYQVAESILSKLVLFNVKNEWMAQYRQACAQQDGGEYMLPDMSFASVEVVVSREAQTIPSLQYSHHDFNLQAAKGVTLESGFRSNNVVRDIIRRLYVRVMNQELSDQLNEERAIDTLKRTIAQRKKQKNVKLRKNYFLLVPNADSPLTDVTVQKEIKILLPDLSFVRIKSGHHEETFIVEDADLMVAISEFYKTLEEYKLQ
ncbi:TIR domain-containing protein [Nitrosomonas oligotropha]|uniref:TIR domain-containing protein n=1 Tax=Nitrosomonas oligotropha TaxID=42354 RepID=A0A2T5I3Q8_9PROT|nr:toll/interleukin-1 receptor domain-containing protein [Nitrosomonas oligotropha]PTQ78408.1 TIR domain-containing protein [Nitrosomonas oligotropha]